MKIVRSLDAIEVREAKSVALTIGVFDGVHLGHKKVIEEVLAAAAGLNGTAAVLTFDPHPCRILGGEEGRVALLTSVEHRLRLLGEAGLHLCAVIPFDDKIARLSGEEFMERVLTPAVDLKRLCVGDGFTFGCGRGGDVKLLRRLGERFGFTVRVVEPLFLEGKKVSSTAIREMIARGDLQTASRFLGRPFSLLGTVVKGKALGREIGVPTANLLVEGEVLPPPGVYMARSRVAGRALDGVLNIDRNGSVEVHFFDFGEEIYGERIELEIGEFIREEMAFSDFGGLARQIRRDIAIARQMLHNGGIGKVSR